LLGAQGATVMIEASRSAMTTTQLLKISSFSRGMLIDESAFARISLGGKVPITLHEYATTGGVTIVADGNVYINAPFDEWYCNAPEAVLSYEAQDDRFTVSFRGERIAVETVPLPGYLDFEDPAGRPVIEVAMSHGDRLRLSPIDGCSLDCRFCDMAAKRYVKRSAEQLLTAVKIARADPVLPVRHVLVSGGAPSRRDTDYFDNVLGAIVEGAGIPVDVMMVAREDTHWIDRLVDLGVYGFSINLEIYDERTAAENIRLKSRIGRSTLARNLERAVELTGGRGRVRSLIVVGLEPIETTLAGVEYLAGLGCDPVLSPFRPAAGTGLTNLAPPTAAYLEELYVGSLEIAERHGVKLGPRCIPCQHNTLTFPDGSADYYFSGARSQGSRT
jgi:Radical SAM superfamily